MGLIGCGRQATSSCWRRSVARPTDNPALPITCVWQTADSRWFHSVASAIQERGVS